MQSRDAVVAEAPALRSALRRSEDRSSELCAESREGLDRKGEGKKDGFCKGPTWRFMGSYKMFAPSLYIGSILENHEDRVSILPERIKKSMPSPEPKPSEGGWLYRVLEPYYSRECVDNVMEAMMGGQISSGASWPRKLAAEVCELYKVPVALPTSSGASALHVALLACNLGPHDPAGAGKGDHVLVPALTMVAVANMVKMVGAKPIYCDSAEGSVNPGIDDLLKKATPRTQGVLTKAVIVCHTYGVACKDIEKITALCKEKGWWLIEDSGYYRQVAMLHEIHGYLLLQLSCCCVHGPFVSACWRLLSIGPAYHLSSSFCNCRWIPLRTS
eukprot:s910_g8.t1